MIAAQTLALMDDSHLIMSLRSDMDPLTSTPTEVELLRRLELAIDNGAEPDIAEAIANHEFTAAELNKLGEGIGEVDEALALIEALADIEVDTIADWKPQRELLDALSDAGIESAEQLTRRLELATKFEALLEDAGDVFTRLSQLTQTAKE